MTEFWAFPAFIAGVIAAMIVSANAFVMVRRWAKYRKSPKMYPVFVLNPLGEYSTTNEIRAPNGEIVLYFAIGLNDDRVYEKPYIAIRFPPSFTIVQTDYTKYYRGKQPDSMKPNEAFFLFNDMVLKRGKISSVEFPLIVKTPKDGDYTLIIKLGANNVGKDELSIPLTLHVVSIDYSEDPRNFKPETFLNPKSP